MEAETAGHVGRDVYEIHATPARDRPGLTIEGIPRRAAAAERIGAALVACRLPLPDFSVHVTVEPRDEPRTNGRSLSQLDLPIALAVLSLASPGSVPSATYGNGRLTRDGWLHRWHERGRRVPWVPVVGITCCPLSAVEPGLYPRWRAIIPVHHLNEAWRNVVTQILPFADAPCEARGADDPRLATW